MSQNLFIKFVVLNNNNHLKATTNHYFSLNDCSSKIMYDGL